MAGQYFNGPMALPNPNANYLTNIAIKYMQNASSFMALDPTLVPIGYSNGTAFSYKVWERADFNRSEMKLRTRGQAPHQARYNVKDQTGEIDIYDLEHPIDDEEYFTPEFAPFQRGPAAIEFLSQQTRLKAEEVFSSIIFVPTPWLTSYTGVASASPTSSQFSQFDLPTTDLVQFWRKEILAFSLRTGQVPNRLYLGAQAWNGHLNNDDLKERLKYTVLGGAFTGAMPAQAVALAQLIGIDKIAVFMGIHNTGKEGLLETNEFIVDPKGALLAHVADTPSAEVPSAFYNILLNGNGQALGKGQAKSLNFSRGIATDYGVDRRAKVEWYQEFLGMKSKVTAADLGVFYGNGVAS